MSTEHPHPGPRRRPGPPDPRGPGAGVRPGRWTEPPTRPTGRADRAPDPGRADRAPGRGGGASPVRPPSGPGGAPPRPGAGPGSRRGLPGAATPQDEHPASRPPAEHPASRPPSAGRSRRGTHRPARPEAPAGPSAGGRVLRGLSGVLAGGLVVLALGLGVVAWLAGRHGVPGPGAADLAAHLAAAAVAVAGQVVADRRGDRTGTLAALGVIGTVGLVLGIGWFL